MRAVLALAGTVVLLLVAFAAAPAAVAGDPCYHGFDIPARSEAADTQIKVAPCAFAPTVTHVAVGSTVTFFNGPDFTHLITGANAEWGSKDVELKPTQKVSYTFAKAGIYPYACALHRGMSGTIVVGDLGASGGAAAASTDAAPAGASGATGSGSPGFGVGQVVAAAVGGLVLGALGALGIVRARRRDEQTLADATART
jgi:plastocyanin